MDKSLFKMFGDKMDFAGTWEVTHRDKDGNIKSVERFDNLVTDEGINYMLNAALHGGTAISSWHIAPWSTNTAVAAGNTYATPGNTEATGYDEATRQEWGEGAASSKSVTNATAAVITATGALSIYGFGIVGGGSAATTKGDAAGGGTLLSSGLFTGGVKTLAAAETLSLTYTISGAAA